jgi:pimeloyl-ACP methyl ester carboxylesterase
MLLKSMNATTWVLLRGLIRESAHWGDFPSLFQKALGASRVLTIDLPGNGEHYRAATPLTLNGVVQAVRKDCQSKGILPQTPVHVLALSLGGMVAVEWMNRYPNEVASAVLVNTSMRGVSPFYRRMSPANYGAIASLLCGTDKAVREKRILQLTSQRTALTDSEIQRRVEIQRLHPVGKINALRQIVAALSLGAKPQAPKQPVLLLNSLGDKLVHPECSTALSARWGIPVLRHAWAGHDLPLDDPEWVIDAIRSWVGAQNPIDNLPSAQ